MTASNPPAAQDEVEMLDGRVYRTTDNWETAVLVERDGTVRKLKGQELHLAQFLAVSKSSAGPS